MSLPRLKSALWVQAQIRLCDRLMISAMVLRKGDPDSGSVLLVLRRRGGLATVLAPTTTLEGERGWMRGTGPEPVPEPDADAYVQRAVARDSDLWVLEIDDREGQYRPDGPLI